MKAPPVPARANLHVALALALHEQPSKTDEFLLAKVDRLMVTVADLTAPVLTLFDDYVEGPR